LARPVFDVMKKNCFLLCVSSDVIMTMMVIRGVSRICQGGADNGAGGAPACIRGGWGPESRTPVVGSGWRSPLKAEAESLLSVFVQ